MIVIEGMAAVIQMVLVAMVTTTSDGSHDHGRTMVSVINMAVMMRKVTFIGWR